MSAVVRLVHVCFPLLTYVKDIYCIVSPLLQKKTGLGALQHSLWPDIHSIHLAIRTKASLFYDFCGRPWIFIQINNFFKLPAQGIEPLTLGMQGHTLSPPPWGLTRWKLLTVEWCTNLISDEMLCFVLQFWINKMKIVFSLEIYPVCLERNEINPPKIFFKLSPD